MRRKPIEVSSLSNRMKRISTLGSFSACFPLWYRIVHWDEPIRRSYWGEKKMKESIRGERDDRCKGRGKVSSPNWTELGCSSSFLVHWSMKIANSPWKMTWLRWTKLIWIGNPFHSPSSNRCPTKAFVHPILWHLLSWPVDPFLSNLNDFWRRFCSDSSWTRQIRRLIISFDRWTHLSKIFSSFFSRWIVLCLFISLPNFEKIESNLCPLPKSNRRKEAQTERSSSPLLGHSLSLGIVSIAVWKGKVCALISVIEMSIFSLKTVMSVKVIFDNQWKRRSSPVVFSYLMFEDSQMRFAFGFDRLIGKKKRSNISDIAQSRNPCPCLFISLVHLNRCKNNVMEQCTFDWRESKSLLSSINGCQTKYFREKISRSFLSKWMAFDCVFGCVRISIWARRAEWIGRSEEMLHLDQFHWMKTIPSTNDARRGSSPTTSNSRWRRKCRALRSMITRKALTGITEENQRKTRSLAALSDQSFLVSG